MSSPSPIDAANGNSGSATVLVVDDDAASARAAADIVIAHGHAAVVCHTWTDAVRAFTRQSIDLVLMDAVMPTVDGFKLTRILRSRARGYVPIVFLTALDDHNARAQGVAAGADDFLSKPIDAIELGVRMTAMLRIRFLTRDLEAKTRALGRLASVDALTGIGNRRSFDERINQELEKTRSDGGELSVLLMDIDHFKLVNDNFGHSVGDDLLALFGRILSELTRACDLPFRYGGEEFVVVSRGTDARQAIGLAERIRSSFALRSRQATDSGAQTVSVGLCGTDQLSRAARASELIVCADAALYRAKAAGRNCVCKYDNQLDVRAA